MAIVPWKNQDIETREEREKVTIGDRVRRGAWLTQEAWQQVLAASNQYQEALDLKENDLEVMDANDAVVLVTLPENRRVYLVAKNTCGAPYGGTWVTILQPRLQGTDMPGIGGGTTFISALSTEDHRLVLQAIKDGHTEFVRKRIWP